MAQSRRLGVTRFAACQGVTAHDTDDCPAFERLIEGVGNGVVV